MTKFFLKKESDGQGPTHSQVLGIVWVSVVLLLIAALAIFLPRKGTPQGDDVRGEVFDTTVLATKERNFYHTQHKAIRPQQDKPNTKYSKQPLNVERYDTVRPVQRKALMVELNDADTLTLQLLSGIGSTLARRIVQYRERLGGYRSMEQLLEVRGITAALVARLEPYITIDTLALRPVNINEVTLKQLVKHPYVEYYQARDIIRLRNAGQTFHSADDLRAVPSMTDSMLQRLLPYISFE